MLLQGGKVWEKAGVNVSVVYGSMPPEAYRAATGSDKEIPADAGRVPFFAAGISSVMHPWNPKVPHTSTNTSLSYAPLFPSHPGASASRRRCVCNM
jgi:coproporphyrinogen III oxidase